MNENNDQSAKKKRRRLFLIIGCLLISLAIFPAGQRIYEFNLENGYVTGRGILGFILDSILNPLCILGCIFLFLFFRENYKSTESIIGSKNNSSKTHSAGKEQISLLWVLAFGFGGIFLLGTLSDRVLSKIKSPSIQLSVDDKIRLREIALQVMQNEDQPTIATQKEFWEILNKQGPLSSDQLKDYRDTLINGASIYQRYFFEDALWALKTGRPFKSNEREDYEKILIKNGVLSEWRVKESESLIAAIAKKEPIPSQDGQVILDEEAIKNILSNLNSALKRVETLLTPQDL